MLEPRPADWLREIRRLGFSAAWVFADLGCFTGYLGEKWAADDGVFDGEFVVNCGWLTDI
jgi:hypothetical protein